GCREVDGTRLPDATAGTGDERDGHGGTLASRGSAPVPFARVATSLGAVARDHGLRARRRVHEPVVHRTVRQRQGPRHQLDEDRLGEMTFESPGDAWLTAHAAEYGFFHPASVAQGTPGEEAWHWEAQVDGT